MHVGLGVAIRWPDDACKGGSGHMMAERRGGGGGQMEGVGERWPEGWLSRCFCFVVYCFMAEATDAKSVVDLVNLGVISAPNIGVLISSH
ncbi:hypothetical protein LWI28_005710 [Acer negundo]|uniref:Uncharacterized protein n=1 Tax=Acer negundo TaxID=4023 RepID=A0AAD5I5M9_ACENE|nr:hypothetical protein LWI28_005710 [Acer negundo]